MPTLPEMTPIHQIKNSHVTHVGHDGDHLFVAYKGGNTYRYENCPADHHAGVLAADSPGTYLHKHVKKNFKYAKVE